MGYNIKAGDRVICDFSYTLDDQSEHNHPRKGTVKKLHHDGVSAIVDFGRGFRGWRGEYETQTHWYVRLKELWVRPSKRRA